MSRDGIVPGFKIPRGFCGSNKVFEAGWIVGLLLL